MAPTGGEKPYRVYRGGRVRGGVPTQPQPARERTTDGAESGRVRYPGPGPKRRRPRGGPFWKTWSWRRWTAVVLLSLFLLLVIWVLAAYLAVRSGVEAANKRLPASAKAVLAPDSGMLLSHASVTALFGIDHSGAAGRAADEHSDSIMLMRFDPGHQRLVYLSIPRDLRVDVPDHGPDKINSAFQIGGPALALKAASEATGMPINHVVIVDFAHFREMVDALGGIDVNVPERILSNKFDCPYTDVRCLHWPGWRFAKGWQHMNGQRAQIYTRIRENQLNPADSDITRSERQQAVMQAILGKLASFSTFLRLPFMGGDLMRPLATDLSTIDLLQLGWDKFRAGSTLHCRLGGNSEGGYIVPSEDNGKVLLEVQGKSAPQPPAPSNETYPPGCFVGNTIPRGR
jgi:LCP family protein required for cell wall assembly